MGFMSKMTGLILRFFPVYFSDTSSLFPLELNGNRLSGHSRCHGTAVIIPPFWYNGSHSLLQGSLIIPEQVYDKLWLIILREFSSMARRFKSYNLLLNIGLEF